MGRNKVADYRDLPNFERKTFPSFVKEIDEEQGVVTHLVAIIGNVDEGGDRIMPGAFTKTLNERGLRVKVLDQHGMDSVTRVVGKPISLRGVGLGELPPEVLERAPDATGGLLATTKYAIDTTRGRDVFRLVKGGYAPESSIGYDAIRTEFVKEDGPDSKERTVRELKELRLWEYSNVVFGMNLATDVLSAKDAKPAPDVTENAIRIRVRPPGEFQEDSFRTISIGAEDNGIQATVGKLEGEDGMTVQAYIFDREQWDVEEAQAWVDEHEKANSGPQDDKRVSGSTSLPLADRERAWDVSAAVARVRNWAGAEDEPNAKYRRAFFWYDAENADKFGAYKLPFADVLDGKLHAVPRAVFAVAATLQGSRGGVDLPEGDAAGVRSRVGRYYARMRSEFDDEGIVPPWEKGMAETEVEVKVEDEAQEAQAAEKVESTKDAKGREGVEVEEKAGRVLARRNAERLTSALRTILDVLDDAGLELDGILPGKPKQEEEDEEEEEMGKGLTITGTMPVWETTSTPVVMDETLAAEFMQFMATKAPAERAAVEEKEEQTEAQAGPDETPPTSRKDALLKEIDIGLHLVEVARDGKL